MLHPAFAAFWEDGYHDPSGATHIEGVAGLIVAVIVACALWQSGGTPGKWLAAGICAVALLI